MSKILHLHDSRKKSIYTKKCVHFFKIEIARIYKIHFLIKIPCKLTNTTQKLLLPFISWNVYTKITQKCNKKRIYNKTPYVKSNKFTPVQKILHLRCR